MSYIKTIDQNDATGQLKDIYDNLSSNIGMIPNIIKVQSLRPDLLEPLLNFIGALMMSEHGLSKTTKELIAAYVSKINSCEY
jgi:hypothetical protein